MELDDLKNIAPNLSNIKKEENFSVPDGYFDTFRQRLDEKINTEEKTPFYVKILELARPQLALASLMLTVVLIGYVGLKIFIPEKPVALNQNEIAQVLEDEIYYMDESFILENFADKNQVSGDADEVSEELVNEIIDYLSEDGMSLDIILEDL